MVRLLDLRLQGRWFDSWLGHYLVVSTLMGEFLLTVKSLWYILVTNIEIISIFHLSGVGESSNSLSGWCYGGAHVVLGGR